MTEHDSRPPSKSNNAVSGDAASNGNDEVGNDEVRRLMFGVPVPVERMARLRQSWPSGLLSADAGPVDTGGRSARQWALIGIALAATAVSIGVAIWLALPTAWDRIDRTQLGELARGSWQLRIDSERHAFQHQLAGRKFHQASKFLKQTPVGWRSFATDLDDEAIVFDLPPKGQAAQLFALRTKQRLQWLPERPPAQPQEARDGGCIAAWQEGEIVYVLTLDGPGYAYRDTIRTRRTSYARFGR